VEHVDEAAAWEIEEEVILTLIDGETFHRRAGEFLVSQFGIEVILASAEHPGTGEEMAASKTLFPWHRVASLETVARHVMRRQDLEWSVRFGPDEGSVEPQGEQDS
jgi:hypothetical protein